jgi:hypothetical protein
VGNCGTNVLYHNNGDGTFSDVTPRSGIRGRHWSASLGWGDLDRDGNLDLYIVNYVVDHLQPCRSQSGTVTVCHPQIFAAEPDALYLNRADGTFAEALQRTGTAAPHGRGLGLVIADFNDDGWPEIYVANDANPSFLFQNLGPVPDGSPQFVEIGFPSGTAINAAGNATAAMGIACADLDGDGRLDLYVTNFHHEADILYLNRGNLIFEDATRRAGLVEATRPVLGWGTQALDADLDGRPEIFLTNGHLDDRRDEGLPWKMRPQLFYNRGDGRFQDISHASGEFFRGEYLGRGVARLDWNRDGRPDLVVVHQDRPAALLQNVSDPTHPSPSRIMRLTYLPRDLWIAEGEHQRCQHKQGHGEREGERDGASSHAPRQTPCEPRVERPARDRRHAGREYSGEEAMQDPDGQDDAQPAIEPSRA